MFFVPVTLRLVIRRIESGAKCETDQGGSWRAQPNAA